MKNTFKTLILTAIILSGISTVNAQNSAFTFQGKLADAGSPANGAYDLQFKLYDLPSGGILFGTLVRDDVGVTQGIFTVTLDYGANVFTTNSGRYLEVAVRPGISTGAFTTINPRQELTASPYSLQSVRAAKADDADNFGGKQPGSYLRSDASQFYIGGNLTISPSSILDVQGPLFGSGANLTNLNAGSISNGTLADARLSTNVARRNEENIFTQFAQFNVPPVASGELITNLGANNIATGTLNDARLSSNIPRLNAGNTFTGANNNFTGRISANTLSVGTGLPITKILTASATLDFGSGRILQQVLTMSVPGARLGDAVYLGIPNSLMTTRNLPATGTTPASVAVEPYIFQAYVSAADTVTVTFMPNMFPFGDGGGPVFPLTACVNSGSPTDTYCADPPPAVFRVVLFSFAP